VPGGFRLTTASGDVVPTRLVAACDGAGSTVRKLLGLREPARKGHLYVLETAPNACDGAMARGLVDFDLSVVEDGIDGYTWDFPTVIGGVPHVSRGIYHANLSARPAAVKGALARALARRGLAIADVRLKPFSTRPFVPGTITWVPGVTLVGEAAGIDQTTGEGIAQAMAMGAVAARHLARAMRSGADAFPAYDRDVRRATFGRHMLESAWLARRVYAPIGEPARRFLLRSPNARSAAIRWYRGESLPLHEELRMGLSLGRDALAVGLARLRALRGA
jgi:flavin-dependent dehydrogenase